MTLTQSRYLFIFSLAIGLTAGVSASAQGMHEQSNMQHGTKVNGEIQDSQGQPLPQAMVQLRDAAGSLIATGFTDAEGRFDLNVGSAGPFRIEASDGGASETAPLDAASLGTFVLRLPTVHVVSTAPASNTVSLDDLEAPKAAKSMLAKAEKALDQRQFDTAWELANEAVAAAPNWGQPYFVRGVLNLENQAYSAARADLMKSLQQNPHNPAALTELGKLYATTGAYQLSETYLKQALQYPPVMWPTYWELASLNFKRGRFAEAARMATDAEYSTPTAPASVHYLAGAADYHLGRWGQARPELEKYLELSAHDPKSAASIAEARQFLAKIPAAAPAAAHPAAHH